MTDGAVSAADAAADELGDDIGHRPNGSRGWAALSITTAAYWAVRLGKEGGYTVGELAEKLGIDSEPLRFVLAELVKRQHLTTTGQRHSFRYLWDRECTPHKSPYGLMAARALKWFDECADMVSAEVLADDLDCDPKSLRKAVAPLVAAGLLRPVSLPAKLGGGTGWERATAAPAADAAGAAAVASPLAARPEAPADSPQPAARPPAPAVPVPVPAVPVPGVASRATLKGRHVSAIITADAELVLCAELMAGQPQRGVVHLTAAATAELLLWAVKLDAEHTPPDAYDGDRP